MAAELKHTFQINGQEVEITDDQLPLIFDLENLYQEFAEVAEQYGEDYACEWLYNLAVKQLLPFIQEIKGRQLSPNFVYQAKKFSNRLEVHDSDYHISDIVERANLFARFNLDPQLGIEALVEKSGWHQQVVERFLLEYEQIKQLVENHLALDPIFALTTINQLAKATFPTQIIVEGKLVNGYASDWYLIAMPATPIHRGNKSYLYAYRIVAVKTANGIEHYVEKQGYFHKHSVAVQASQFLELPEKPRQTGLLDLFKWGHLPDERELMLAVHRRHDGRAAKEMLIDMGVAAGNQYLPSKVKLQEVKEQKQLKDIANAARVIVKVLARELRNPDTAHRSARLRILFEALGNPLFFEEGIPVEAIFNSYNQHLVTATPNQIVRNAFLESLINLMPTLRIPVVGNFLCGAMSAGGLTKQGAAGQISRNQYGGLLATDRCLNCPRCHQVSSNGKICSNCGYHRGESLSKSIHGMNSFRNRQYDQKQSGSPISSNHQRAANFLDMLIPSRTSQNSVGVGRLLEFGPKTIKPVSEFLSAV